MRSASMVRERAPVTVQATAAVAASAEPGPPAGQPLRHRRRCRRGQNAPGRVPGAAQPAVRINSALDGLCGPPEQRDRVPAPRVPEQRVSGGAGQQAGRQRPA